MVESAWALSAVFQELAIMDNEGKLNRIAYTTKAKVQSLSIPSRRNAPCRSQVFS